MATGIGGNVITARPGPKHGAFDVCPSDYRGRRKSGVLRIGAATRRPAALAGGDIRSRPDPQLPASHGVTPARDVRPGLTRPGLLYNAAPLAAAGHTGQARPFVFFAFDPDTTRPTSTPAMPTSPGCRGSPRGGRRPATTRCTARRRWTSGGARHRARRAARGGNARPTVGAAAFGLDRLFTGRTGSFRRGLEPVDRLGLRKIVTTPPTLARSRSP